MNWVLHNHSVWGRIEIEQLWILNMHVNYHVHGSAEFVVVLLFNEGIYIDSDTLIFFQVSPYSQHTRLQHSNIRTRWLSRGSRNATGQPSSLCSSGGSSSNSNGNRHSNCKYGGHARSATATQYADEYDWTLPTTDACKLRILKFKFKF